MLLKLISFVKFLILIQLLNKSEITSINNYLCEIRFILVKGSKPDFLREI